MKIRYTPKILSQPRKISDKEEDKLFKYKQREKHMNKRSEAVLDHLRGNSRKSLAAIAREEGVAVSTIFDHVNKLASSVIEKHTSLLNYPALGYPFRTFFYCDAPNQQDIINFFKKHQNTNNIHQLSSGLVAAEMIFSSLHEEEEVKEHLEEQCDKIQQHRILEPVLLEGWVVNKRTSSDNTTNVSDSSQ